MVRMNEFSAEPTALRDSMIDAVQRVFSSGWYVLGPEVRTFEEAWSSACGCRWGVGVGNGMDALELGLRAAGIASGAEVIVPSMTAFATALAVVRSGATPVFADVDPLTGVLCPESVERCRSTRTRAIILVHLYGRLHEPQYWREYCHKTGILLVEDCAQAHGACHQGQSAGSFGTFGAYSFYPTKNLGCVGDGGMVVTNDEELANKIRILRNYGQADRYHHPELGVNSRLDELQAAILTVRLEWLERFNSRRREVAASYRRQIKNPHVRMLQPASEPCADVHHLFVVLCPERNKLQTFLSERGIQTLIHYPIPLHQQPPFREARRDSRGVVAAEAHAKSCLSLPCHPQLGDQDVSEVIDAVKLFDPTR